MTKFGTARCSTELSASTVSSRAAPARATTAPSSIVKRKPNRR